MAVSEHDSSTATPRRMVSAPATEIRAQMAIITRALTRIDGQLEHLEGSAPSRERKRPDRYYSLLVDVYEHGIHGVDQATLWRIGSGHGYDRRGLGGFFAGSRAPLQAGLRVTLTAEGRRLVDVYLDTLPEPA